MVRRKGILQVVLLTLVVVLVATPALAASVVNATFRGDLVCSNSSGDTLSNTCSVFNINTQALIDGSFVDADLLNTAVQTPGGSDAAFMPGVGTNPWILYSGTIAPYEHKSFSLYTGGPAMQTTIAYFPDTAGMTVAYSASLELGNNFEVELQGYVDTTAGTDKNLVFKDLAFKIWVSGAEEVSASIYKDGGWTACVVTAADIPSEVHFIEVVADIQNLKLYIDGNLKDTEVLGGTISVPDNANGWSFATNGSMIYVEWLKIWVD